MYKAGVALNLKRVFPLFNTTKVCGERKREKPLNMARNHQKKPHLFFFFREETNSKVLNIFLLPNLCFKAGNLRQTRPFLRLPPPTHAQLQVIQTKGSWSENPNPDTVQNLKFSAIQKVLKFRSF